MMLQEIANYLAVQGVGVLATNLFYGAMPDTPNDAVGLFEYAGRPPEYTMDGAVVADTPGLQVVSRSMSYITARQKMQLVLNALSGKGNMTLGSSKYHIIVANGGPFPLGLDEMKRHRLVANFSVTRETE